MLGSEDHSNCLEQCCSKQLFLTSCTWFAELLLESTVFLSLTPVHSLVSGSDRTVLMCDTRDRGALHAADSLTRIACERARTCDYPWTFMPPTFHVWERVFSPLPVGCNQLMWKHIVCNHVTDRSHFIYSAGWATPAITQHWEECSPLFTPQHSSHSILFSTVSKPKQPAWLRAHGQPVIKLGPETGM